MKRERYVCVCVLVSAAHPPEMENFFNKSTLVFQSEDKIENPKYLEMVNKTPRTKQQQPTVDETYIFSVGVANVSTNLINLQ